MRRARSTLACSSELMSSRRFFRAAILSCSKALCKVSKVVCRSSDKTFKQQELGFDNGIHYTDRGRLVGHMGIACEMIDDKASTIDGFPQDLRDILKHIVLSHHGKLEYGSPKLPMLAEAVVVAMIDDLDS